MMMFVSSDVVPWQWMFESAPVAISMIDPFGRQIASNAAYAELFGYTLDEMEEIDVGRLTRSSDQDWTRSYLTKLASGDIDRYETDKVYVRKDGTEFTARLSARALRDDDGHCSMLTATIVPVVERPPVGDSLARRLLEFTNDSLTVIDVDGNVRETTGRYAPVLGYPPEFWHDRTVFDLVEPDDRDRLVELREHLLERPGASIDTEIEVRGADGSEEMLHVRAMNCLDDPEIAGIVITTRNITEHLRTVAELSRNRETAEAVADARTRLLATVSHELRNPLHAVQGLSELLTEEELPTAAGELAETLRRQLSSLTQVTQDLLDAARLDAGQVVIDLRPTNLAALVSDVVSLGEAAAAGKPVDVSSMISVGVPDWLLADGDRVRQVLSNLIGNAVKFTDAGSVQIIVRHDAGGSINFSVVDTGVGIPGDEQTAVLEPFRVGSTGGEQRGAGLGLSIVQRLVDAMGGRVEMSSQVGSGTRFDVWLPLDRASAPESADGDELMAGLRILVVEDNPVNQQLAKSQLERLGLVPVIVGSGEAALDLLDGPDGESFDMVLMDHQLPGISGIETTALIRQRHGPIADLPVVGLSASASTGDARAFIAAGMNDFLAKPASMADLSETIARTHRLARSSGGAADDGATDPASVLEADATVPDFDVDVLDGLIADLGDGEIVAGLVETFLTELDGRTRALADRSGDAQTAQRAAHTLKSSARLLGAMRLADACQAVEGDADADVDVGLLATTVKRLMTNWLEQRGKHD